MVETALSFPRGRRETEAAIAELEAEIRHGRERVASSLRELKERLARVTSWRRWAAAHPVAWLCAGVYAGLLAGRGARRR
jgi:hypothetical protein